MKKPDTFLFVRSSRRHTEFPFPPERYLPGKNTARNHELPSFPDEREQFLYGVDLFNHHYWWEAHEVWESLCAVVGSSMLILFMSLKNPDDKKLLWPTFSKLTPWPPLLQVREGEEFGAEVQSCGEGVSCNRL